MHHDHSLSKLKFFEITDPHLVEMLHDIAVARKIPKHSEYRIRPFLAHALHHQSIARRQRFKRDEFLPTSPLRLKLAKLRDTPIFDLCREIAGPKAGSLEHFENVCLFEFLNRQLGDLRPKKKRKPGTL